jgi:hypothetical protein
VATEKLRLCLGVLYLLNLLSIFIHKRIRSLVGVEGFEMSNLRGKSSLFTLVILSIIIIVWLLVKELDEPTSWTRVNGIPTILPPRLPPSSHHFHVILLFEILCVLPRLS